ncbi:MAG: caspase family protein [Flammeovirgaceae bacterium]|nr:MAG: caspase family protein [Flammeovirgaceae bacterium]
MTTNSRRIIIGGDKGSLSVYEPASQDVWNLPSHAAKINAMAVSYDNRFVAASSEDGNVSLYDFTESKPLKLNGATGTVRALSFSPTGLVLASGNDEGKVSLWNCITREKIQTFQSTGQKILCLAFSPDGKKLAWGSVDNVVIVWDVEDNKQIHALRGHKDWVRAIAFSRDGQSLTTGSYDKTIRHWNTQTGELNSTLTGHRSWVTDLNYSPDGKYLISSGADGQAIIFDKAGKMTQRITDLSQVVCASQFSYDGRFIVAADLTPVVKLYNCTVLNIEPWKPFDITPPSVVILSPKLLASKDIASGSRKSSVHQSSVRLLLEVNDLSGVTEVLVNGNKLERIEGYPDRYQFNFSVPINTESTLVINATDKIGNVAQEKLLVEHKPFSGTINKDKYYALLIANQVYSDPGIVSLDQPVKDMQRLRQALLQYYSFDEKNITVMENPNRNQLYAALDELQAKLDKLDNLLIFYAGHGYWDEQLQQGYWLPSDAEPNKRSTWLSNGTLRDYIGGIGARHTLLVTDACFSGGIFKSRSIFENASAAIETLYLRKSRKAMTSGTLEKVPDRSVFIDFLIRRLEQNQEPYITAEELFSGLRREVINNSPNNQVPQYGEIGQTGDEGGEFIFIRKN